MTKRRKRKPSLKSVNYKTGQEVLNLYRRIRRISSIFSLVLFAAVVLLFGSVFLLKSQIGAFSVLSPVSSLKKLFKKDFLLLLALLFTAIFFIVLSAYFIKGYSSKRIKRLKHFVKSIGKREKGRIIQAEVIKKSIYEVVYKVIIELDNNETAFCFYEVDKSEPSPIGECWRLYYDKGTTYAVLLKRINPFNLK